MSHGLDRIKWNNEGETMSHPPETSLSSRELAAKIASLYVTDGETYIYTVKAAALIEAWVRVREAAARLDQLNADDEARRCIYDYYSHNRRLLDSALATARKQLEDSITTR